MPRKPTAKKTPPKKKRSFPWRTALGVTGGLVAGAALLSYLDNQGSLPANPYANRLAGDLQIPHADPGALVMGELEAARAQAAQINDVPAVNELAAAIDHTRVNGLTPNVVCFMRAYGGFFPQQEFEDRAADATSHIDMDQLVMPAAAANWQLEKDIPPLDQIPHVEADVDEIGDDNDDAD